MPSSPFLNSIQQQLRQRGYALKTEKTYLYWIKYLSFFTTSNTQALWVRLRWSNF